jgi:hypothetical protein
MPESRGFRSKAEEIDLIYALEVVARDGALLERCNTGEKPTLVSSTMFCLPRSGIFLITNDAKAFSSSPSVPALQIHSPRPPIRRPLIVRKTLRESGGCLPTQKSEVMIVAGIFLPCHERVCYSVINFYSAGFKFIHWNSGSSVNCSINSSTFRSFVLPRNRSHSFQVGPMMFKHVVQTPYPQIP